MDKTEARTLLVEELAWYRELAYGDLAELVGSNFTSEVRGPSGAEYQVEIDVMWDSPRENANIRVMGAIDDGRLPGALKPLCDSFILSPDGRFMGQ